MSPVCDVRIQSKIARVDSGQSCAHEVTRMLGERLLTASHETGGCTDSEYMLQDAGFSLLRTINARIMFCKNSFCDSEKVPCHDAESFFELAPSQLGRSRDHA